MSRDSEEVWSPDYDSTWEEEEEEKPRSQREPGNRRQLHGPNNCRKCWSRAARDLQNYRHGYEYDKDYQYYTNQPLQTPNLDFYQNKKRFEPDGLFITALLEKWKKKYDVLERNHSYIQWLFPLREYGMNSCAKPLTKTEIEVMKKDEDVQKRFLDAYKLMLDFYGIELEDERSGKVTRAKDCEDRFRNLNDHSHNNLRITRILKCLGELGFEHYQAPLVKFFLKETLCNGRLQNVKRSCLDYFMFTVKDKNERRKLVHFAWEKYKPERFIWGPVEKLRTYQPPAENEHEANNCQKEKNNESDEEKKINGQLGSYENNSDEEYVKDYSDSLTGNVECQQNSIKSDKKEFIPLNDRAEGKKEPHGKFPDKGSASNSEAASDSKGLLSSSSSLVTNGAQVPTEGADKKSHEDKEPKVSCEVLPKPECKKLSPVGRQEESEVDGHGTGDAVIGTQNENREQDNLPKMENVTVEPPRKRKMTNVASDGKGTSDRSLPQSDDNSGLPREGGDRNQMDTFEDQVKKLRLRGPSVQDGVVAGHSPSTAAGRDLQKPGDDSDVNQECRQMETEEAKEEMPKLNEPLNSEDHEKDPLMSSSNSDPK